jgi:hypothetical protein
VGSNPLINIQYNHLFLNKSLLFLERTCFLEIYYRKHQTDTAALCDPRYAETFNTLLRPLKILVKPLHCSEKPIRHACAGAVASDRFDWLRFRRGGPRAFLSFLYSFIQRPAGLQVVWHHVLVSLSFLFLLYTIQILYIYS